jgi:hypothetical protein
MPQRGKIRYTNLLFRHMNSRIRGIFAISTRISDFVIHVPLPDPDDPPHDIRFLFWAQKWARLIFQFLPFFFCQLNYWK